MKIKNLILFSLIMFFGCTRQIENCDCEKMEIHYVSPGILSPISIPEKEFIKGEVTRTVYDTSEIRNFYHIIENLESVEENYGDIDVRILVDLFCKNGGKATITANRFILKNGKKYYHPSDEFFDFFESTAEKYWNDFQKSRESKSSINE